MRYTKFEMPALNIGKEELTLTISKLLSGVDSLEFNGFLDVLSRHLIAIKRGFDTQPNTDYTGSWRVKDKALVNEILWDFIIKRFLTPGGNGHDGWPNLTITELGKDYFSAFR